MSKKQRMREAQVHDGADTGDYSTVGENHGRISGRAGRNGRVLVFRAYAEAQIAFLGRLDRVLNMLGRNPFLIVNTRVYCQHTNGRQIL